MTEGNRSALIIGNSQYKDKTLNQLVTPVQDAQALAEVLKNPAIGAFQVDISLDKESHHLRLAIEKFFTHAKRDDTLLLYFSGHGITDELSGELYLATIDTEYKYLDATAIPAGFIRRMIQKSQAERKILILDSCFSGAFTNEILAKGEGKVTVGQQFGRGVIILTASTALQRAFEGTTIKELSKKGIQSIFTRFLVQGLKTGEASRHDSHIITISDLFHYAETQMRQVRPDQSPQMTGIEQQGEIVIANSVKPRKVTLPEGISRLLKSRYQTDLLAAIGDLLDLAKTDDSELVQLAVQELQKLSLHQYVVVQNAAKAALDEVGQSPPKVFTPLMNRMWAYLLSHRAIFIGVAIPVVVLLIGGLNYPTLTSWLNSTPIPISTPTQKSLLVEPAPPPTFTPDVKATETSIAGVVAEGIFGTQTAEAENWTPVPEPAKTSTNTPTSTVHPESRIVPTVTPTVAAPQPTATPIPPTNTAISAASTIPGVIFQDDFSSNTNGWYTGSDSSDTGDATWELVDGKYRQSITFKKWGHVWSFSVPQVNVRDLVFTTDVTIVDATDVKDYATVISIVFRNQDNNKYWAQFSNAGYRLGVEIGGDWKIIKDFTATDAFKIEPGITNSFGVSAKGPRIGILANNQEVFAIEDQAWGGDGTIEVLVMGQNPGQRTTVDFDNILIKEPG